MPISDTKHTCSYTRRCIIFVLLLSFQFTIITKVVAQIGIHSVKIFNDNFGIQNITINNGLPNNFVEDVYKDTYGFIWLATKSGVSRFDGNDFVNYNYHTSDLRLKSNFVHKICEDRFKRLWFASESGINIFNLRTYKEEILLREEISFLSQTSLFVFCDSKGNIWLSSLGGLHKISFKKDGKISKIISLNNIQSITNSSVISSIYEYAGKIWIGNGNKVFVVDEKSGISLKLKKVDIKQNLRKDCNINCFCEYAGSLWIGTTNGLIEYNPRKKNSHLYKSDNSINSLTDNNIMDIKVYHPDNSLLIATLKGLNIYKNNGNEVIQIKESSKIGLSSDFINCIYIDKSLIWLGTEINGLNRIFRRDFSMHIFSNDSFDASSLSKGSVNAIFQDKEKNLWVGTVGGGLNKKNANNDTFVHYRANTANSISNNHVTFITQDSLHTLWVGTWGGGLNKKEKNSNKFVTINKANSNLRNDNIGSISYDKYNNVLWIGTEDGVSYFDYSTNKVKTLKLPFDNFPTNSLSCMLIDKHKRLWIGSQFGLVIMDLKSFSKEKNDIFYIYYRYKLDKRRSRILERINCILEDSKGRIWLGTNGNGLYRAFAHSNDHFSFINCIADKAYADNMIYGIEEDAKGDLWISTNNGLIRFSADNNRFKQYTKNGGLFCDQYYWNGAFKSPFDNSLYFGSINGFIQILNTDEQNKDFVPQLFFTNFQVQNKEIKFQDDKYLDSSIITSNCINLHERDRSFSIEFASLNYQENEQCKFEYRLKGFDNNWIVPGKNKNMAYYTNVPAGKYMFQVKVIGDEDSKMKEIEVSIKPYFYKTIWFYLFVTMLVILSFAVFYNYRVKYLKRMQRILTKKVTERTQMLQSNMKLLIEKNNLLNEQKEQMRILSDKVQKVSDERISFFTNITHEFRTPITLISGPLNMLINKCSDNSMKQQLNMIKRNSNYLLSLVNQLLDFRKIESQKIEIIRRPNDLMKTFNYSISPFIAYANDKGIKVNSYFHSSNDILCLIDEEWLYKVMVNLLSNAMKFTPKGGDISIFCYYSKKWKKLYLCVRDSGIGIEKKYTKLIFDKFYQAKRADYQTNLSGQSGTGIGLYLCKSIITAHGGEIEAVANKTKGTSFRIVIPVDYQFAEEINISKKIEKIEEKEVEKVENEVVNGATILVVDDNSDMREYIRSILSDEYKVIEAENGLWALRSLEHEKVDCIVSDIMMPVMDGLEFSHKVKEDVSISHIPFIMLTAKVNEKTKMECYQVGIDIYMSKPFNAQELKLRIRNIFEILNKNKQNFAINMDASELNIPTDTKDSKMVDKIMSTIERCYKDTNLDVDKLAAEIGVSRSLLNMKMQELMGTSTAKFIASYRLKKAHDLIKINMMTNELNISTIAFEVGFSDPSYFTRCFTKKYGVSPSKIDIT